MSKEKSKVDEENLQIQIRIAKYNKENDKEYGARTNA